MAKKSDTRKVLAAPSSGRIAGERMPQVSGAILQRASEAAIEPAPAAAEPLPASRWPSVDDYLDEPDEVHRWERIGGERRSAMPATEDHGDPHFKLDALVDAHLAEDYVGSTDLKTRVNQEQEYASDTCVRRAGIEPATGRRYLEELVFEVIHKRSAKQTKERARGFAARGVRRQIGIFVRERAVREWRAKRGDWGDAWDLGLSLPDPCLAVPLPLAALFDPTLAKVAIARALAAKDDPVIRDLREKSEKRGRARGKAEGLAEGEAKGLLAMRNSIMRVLDRRFESLPADLRQKLDGIHSVERLEEILDQALTVSSVDDLVFENGPSN